MLSPPSNGDSSVVAFQLFWSEHSPCSLHSYGNLTTLALFFKVRHLLGPIWEKTHFRTWLTAHSTGTSPAGLGIWSGKSFAQANLWSRLTWLNLQVWVQGVLWPRLLRSPATVHR